MRVPLRRGRRSVLAGTVAAGLVLSVALSWSATHAAFSASTGNSGNSWQTGSVVLADGDNGAALFSSASDGALLPGVTRSRCIRLDYTGDVPAEIRMYVGTPPAGAVALDPYLVLSVERGADVGAATAVAPDCGTGFTPTATPTLLYNTHRAADPAADRLRTLADLKTRSDWATGVVVSPGAAPNTSLTLRISYVVVDDNAAQRSQSQATFTWEARNT